MFFVALAMGILAGILLRRQRTVVEAVERLVPWTIVLLLFVLGISVGSNQSIMEALPALGRDAAVLSLGSIVGSLALGYLLSRTLFRHDEE